MLIDHLDVSDVVTMRRPTSVSTGTNNAALEGTALIEYALANFLNHCYRYVLFMVVEGESHGPRARILLIRLATGSREMITKGTTLTRTTTI